MDLTATRCPLCGRWIAGGSIAPPGGCHVRFVARLDLCAAVCANCDHALGPDTVRMAGLRLCTDADQAVARYMRTWEDRC